MRRLAALIAFAALALTTACDPDDVPVPGESNIDVDTPALLEAAKREGVAFVAGPDFMLEGGASSLRLSFASVPAESVAEGVSRLARALAAQRAGAPA